MQVDSISRLTNRPSREECVERSLCFYCKKPGHVAEHCFQSKASEARPGSPYRPSPRQVQRPPQPRFVDQRPQPVQTYQHRNLSPPAMQHSRYQRRRNSPAGWQNQDSPQRPGYRVRFLEPGHTEDDTHTASSSVSDLDFIPTPTSEHSGKD